MARVQSCDPSVGLGRKNVHGAGVKANDNIVVVTGELDFLGNLGWSVGADGSVAGSFVDGDLLGLASNGQLGSVKGVIETVELDIFA